MSILRCTLLADGSADRALIPILLWLIHEHADRVPVEMQFADLRRLHKPPRRLSDRIDSSIDLYPCDVLFVHRDAERELLEARTIEIQRHCHLSKRAGDVEVVTVIPIRMSEAWLLFDEDAVRIVAGNPGGGQALDMPRIEDIEGLPDPKERLHELLRSASGLRDRRRRLEQFNRDLGLHVQRVAIQIDNFNPLRDLTAFGILERQVMALFQE